MFPVYAGVIPKLGKKLWGEFSVPRVCGGDPDDSFSGNASGVCSPCMRG